MSRGEAESGPARAGWSRESNPQAKGRLSGHPRVGAADNDIPCCLFPTKGTCPSHSAMGRAPQTLTLPSGDTRDDLQASEDGWETGRPDRAIRETGRGGKSVFPEQGQLSGGQELGENPQEHPHSPQCVLVNPCGRPRPISKLALRPSSQRKQL